MDPSSVEPDRDSFWMRIIAILSVVVSGAVAFLILGPRPEGMEGSIQAIPTPLDDGGLSFDEIATGLPDSVLQKGGGITVEANNERVVLEDAPVDALFTIRTTEEEEIESPSDLETLQKELSEAGPQIAQLPAAQRQMAEEARELVEAKLERAKQLFDDQSRGALTGQAFTAKLKSL